MDKTKTLTIIEDSREQTPLDFAPYEAFGVAVERRKLRTGDYSVAGYEHHFAIERKSLNDLVSTLTHGRERFTREVYDRLSFFAFKEIVVEADWQEISRPYDFAPGANPLGIVNSLASLTMPPVGMHVFASRSRALIAWHIVTMAANFVRRATHGSSGMWRSIFAPDSADLAPFPAPYKTIGG